MLLLRLDDLLEGAQMKAGLRSSPPTHPTSPRTIIIRVFDLKAHTMLSDILCSCNPEEILTSFLQR